MKVECVLKLANNACGFITQTPDDHGSLWIASTSTGSISSVADTSTAESNTWEFNTAGQTAWEEAVTAANAIAEVASGNALST